MTRRIPPVVVNRYTPGILLLLWTVIAAGLRFWNVDAKPPWTDEFATWVFSLGNQFSQVPVGQLISAEDLLQLLQPTLEPQPSQVAERLLNQDNHPPLFFVLAHYWYRFFPDDNGYLNITVGRSLPVIFGVLTVPVGYWCGKWVWKKERIAQAIALLMAVSPYGVFIAQEARHYTLAMLWGLISIACCLKAGQYWQRQEGFPRRLILMWVGVNAIALSIHFFLGLLIAAEGLALLSWRYQGWRKKEWDFGRGIQDFYWVTLGTAAAIAVWGVLISQREFGNNMTHWIQFNDIHFWGYFGPPFQLLAAWITMFCLLPVESSQLAIVILSGLGMLIYFCWLLPLLRSGFIARLNQTDDMQGLLWRLFGYLFFLYLAITYGTGMDITRGARYSFTFWPILMELAGVGLAKGIAQVTARASTMINKSKKEVRQSTVNALPSPATDQRPWLSGLMRSYRFPWPWLIILLVGIASGATITHNLGYQKYYRPEQFLAQLVQTPTADERWLVTTHQSLVQTGEMLGLAVTIRRDYPQLMDSVKFLLIPQTELHSPASTDFLWQQLAQRTQAVDLWLVNYLAAKDLPQCTAAPQPPVGVFGYDYRHFNCPGPNPISATVTAAPTP